MTTGGTQPGGPERTADGRWIIVKGRRWRAQDPELPEELTAPLLSALGRARSALARRRTLSEPEVCALRDRVQLAKEGLGERGTPWWEMSVGERRARARRRLDELAACDPDPAARRESSSPRAE